MEINEKLAKNENIESVIRFAFMLIIANCFSFYVFADLFAHIHLLLVVTTLLPIATAQLFA